MADHTPLKQEPAESMPGRRRPSLGWPTDDSTSNEQAMTAETVQMKTVPYGKSFGASLFRCCNCFLTTQEAILALHIVGLDDKIAHVSHFHLDFADYPLPAQKTMTARTMAGEKIKAVQLADGGPARIEPYKGRLTAAGSQDNAVRQGTYAPPAAP